MDLDDQLSALAAGELDEDEARRLRARVAGDPVLRERLARLERLDALLTGWDVAPMDAEQVAALDEAVTDALDALGDAPLSAGGAAEVGAARPLAGDEVGPDTGPGGVGPGRAGGDAEVVDLAEARARREVPRWVTGVLSTAAAIAVIATVGIGLGSVTGGFDDAGESLDDTALAESAQEESFETEEESFESELEEADSGDESGDGGSSIATLLPIVVELDELDVDALPRLVPPELLTRAATLADERATAPDDLLEDEAALVREDVLGSLPPSACLEETLDTLPLGDVLVLVGTGTVDGEAAIATVVVRATDDGPVTVTQVLRTDGCTVVAEESSPV